MLSYELAKQLKEAGFPIKDREECEIGNCWENGHEHCYPTLSELIEACGDGFSHLVRYYKYDKLFWEAATPKNGILGFECLSDSNTAEEAVANLWLALNKK